MKKLSLRVLTVLLSIGLTVSVFGGCADRADHADPSAKPTASDFAIIHETEFGGIYIETAIDDFNALGFAYGDSVDVSFSNGYRMPDLPYYNGYYTQTGEPLVVAYPGYPYVKVCINNGDDLWKIAAIDENTTVTVSLNEQGKYRDLQNARDIHYTDERNDYESDGIFANFRSIGVSTMKENFVYRSASPCDNQHNRASFVNKLIEQAGVKYIVNLADNEEKIQGYLSDENFECDYFRSLYENGNVLALAMNMNFGSDEFRRKAARGLTAMTEHDGPFLVHCTEGKDRTGFLCMLLEALSGAEYREIVNDYMITYDNYYGINEKDEKEKYDIIVENVLDPMIRSIVGDDSVDITAADLSGYAGDYLLSGGMSAEQISALKAAIRPAAENSGAAA